jgi:hypothetical protein
MSSDRQRAETIIKKEERARDGAAAMIEYQAKAIATREKTAHLKALRVDREAQTAELKLTDTDANTGTSTRTILIETATARVPRKLKPRRTIVL